MHAVYRPTFCSARLTPAGPGYTDNPMIGRRDGPRNPRQEATRRRRTVKAERRPVVDNWQTAWRRLMNGCTALSLGPPCSHARTGAAPPAPLNIHRNRETESWQTDRTSRQIYIVRAHVLYWRQISLLNVSIATWLITIMRLTSSYAADVIVKFLQRHYINISRLQMSEPCLGNICACMHAKHNTADSRFSYSPPQTHLSTHISVTYGELV